MWNEILPRQSPSRPRWQSVAIGLLLFAGVAGIVAWAIYLLYPTGLTPLSLVPDVVAIEPAEVSPRPDYAGRIAFKCDLSGNGFCLIDPQGGGAVPLSDPSLYEEWRAQEAFSPEGSRVAFSRRIGEGYDIFVRDVQGGWVDQLVSNPGADYQPAWSPTGDLLAYVSQVEGGAAIWVCDLGARVQRQLTRSRDRHPTWSPNGAQIAFWSDRDGAVQLYVMNADGSQARPLGPDGSKGWDPVWIKPPRTEGLVAPEATSQEALGMGLAFDGELCRVEISAGDSSGEAPVTRVILYANDEVVHDSGLIQTPLYHAVAELGPELGEKRLLLRAWNAGAFAGAPNELRRDVVCAVTPPTATPEPTLGPSPTPTLTPIVVTPDPTPADVFAAATRVAEVALQATRYGPPTATPPNLVTTTPVGRPFVIVNTPAPENQATATYQVAFSTAVAGTTGTPTPLPDYAVTATPSLTPILATPEPTPVDVFAAATRVVEMDQWVARFGTPTATPPNLVTTTPVPGPFVIVNTPRPENWATAAYQAALATAIAATTGTPTPIPLDAVTATPTPWPTRTPAPTATPVLVPLTDSELLALYVSAPELASTPTMPSVPPALAGKIAFRSDRFGGAQVFVMDADGSNVALLTSSWPYEEALRREWVSPDGRHVVYQSSRGTHGLDLFLRSVDGGDPARLTYVGSGVAYDPAWSPDGTRIVFASNQQGPDQIFVVERVFGNPRTVQLTSNEWEGDKHPSYSPDVRYIVFCSNRTGSRQLWVMKADGTDLRLLWIPELAGYECWDPVWIKQ